MNKPQFWTLNLTSLILVILMVGHFFAARRNSQLGEEITRDQATISNARQHAGLLDQLAQRIAKGSETDPRLTNILSKYGLNVSLVVDGQKKNYP